MMRFVVIRQDEPDAVAILVSFPREVEPPIVNRPPLGSKDSAGVSGGGDGGT